ncbi:hypothetical protein LINGRAHAP2_LOCUS23603, partial [Linum grandiflorum]
VKFISYSKDHRHLLLVCKCVDVIWPWSSTTNGIAPPIKVSLHSFPKLNLHRRRCCASTFYLHLSPSNLMCVVGSSENSLAITHSSSFSSLSLLENTCVGYGKLTNRN